MWWYRGFAARDGNGIMRDNDGTADDIRRASVERIFPVSWRFLRSCIIVILGFPDVE